MMQKQNNLQDQFLSRARQGRLPVTVFLMNGYQLRGLVTGFDAFVMFLTTDNKQQMIYKHAISTIIPEKPVELSETE
ncbi:MAG: RNA chaperone Hfq [Pseudoflavonifractor sp.]